MSILENINSPADLKALPGREIPELCAQLRAFLVENVSKTGGHLASNLGAVELTVAIHRVYDTERDRLVFDVGHQSYVHKILTGRRDAFSTLRQYGGIAGFPKPGESVHDAFVAGHASTSISVALGMARARTLRGEDYDVVALIGDGALTGGLAFEGLSDAGQSGEPLVIILNDNGMSIKKNVGGMASLLSRQRVTPGYLRFKQVYRETVGRVKPLYDALHHVKESVMDFVLPRNMFADMGFYYIGPVDGHDERELERVLRWARSLRQPVLLHVVTKKGKGVDYTERAPERYHGVGPFDARTGALPAAKPCFSAAFGDELTRLAVGDRSVVAITAAMCSGTGLTPFAARLPERFYDVGIAEEHAVTMAAAMAQQGLRPVLAIYSSFLQRAYDMLIHDVSLLGTHVVLGVDRAGIVGSDGDTHNGCFDVSYLGSVPGMTLLCPASFAELRAMLYRALYELPGPVALRYPRGGEGTYTDLHPEAVCRLRLGRDVTLVTYGVLVNEALAAADMLAAGGIEAEVLKLGQVQPLETEEILRSLQKTGRLLAAEDVCAPGCVGARILAAAAAQGVPLRGVRLVNLGDGRVPHGATAVLLEKCGLSAERLAQTARELCAGEERREKAAT